MPNVVRALAVYDVARGTLRENTLSEHPKKNLGVGKFIVKIETGRFGFATVMI